MTDSPSREEKGPDPFQQMGDSEADAGPSFGASEASGEPDPLSSAKMQASFALSIARSWVEEHQTASMLGAFATGVVLGSLFRD